MFGAILAVLLIGAGLLLMGSSVVSLRLPLVGRNLGTQVAGPLFLVLGLFIFATRSFVIVGPNEVGHLVRIYFADSMKTGQVIALDGQKGPQAKTLPPGFHFIPFVRVLNDVTMEDIVEIPDGFYGKVTAKDGRPLREGQFLADQWPEESFMEMTDAEYFLSEGGGQKGPQLSVLRPGRYRLNKFLFDVSKAPALDVPTGSVAVIRSNVETGIAADATLKRLSVRTIPQETPEGASDDEKVVNGDILVKAKPPKMVVDIEETPISACPNVVRSAGGATGDTVAMPVVPRGCVGVWDEPLPPGRFYLHSDAYVPTIIPTRLQTWAYQGGYIERTINLEVTEEGRIKQQINESAEPLPVPPEAADKAILVRVEGWTVPVEMRVVAQVHPQDAPFVVASVGDLKKIEDNIVTPTIRDILRTIAGEENRKVLDFISNREEITSLVESVIAIEAKKAGVTIQEARMGEPAIPPELLVARLREQLATQLQDTYTQEKLAQIERVNTEKARATADQQPTLVQAEIDKQAAEFRKEQARLQGEGERLRLEEIARGQARQAEVLGQERTLQLQMLKEVLSAALQQPDIIKVPSVNVSGAQGLEGGAAVLGTLLGGSNVAGMVTNQSGR